MFDTQRGIHRTFRRVLSSYYDRLAREKSAFLKKVVIFSELEEAQFCNLTSQFTTKTLRLGEFVYREGTPISEVYVVHKGKFTVRKTFAGKLLYGKEAKLCLFVFLRRKGILCSLRIAVWKIVRLPRSHVEKEKLRAVSRLRQPGRHSAIHTCVSSAEQANPGSS